MPKLKQGALISITEDIGTEHPGKCYRILSDDIINTDVVKLQDHLTDFARIRFSAPKPEPRSFDFEECLPIWELKSVGSKKYLGRTPKLPTWGLYLSKVLVEVGNKTRRMALVLGPDRKYLVSLHMLSKMKKPTP